MNLEQLQAMSDTELNELSAVKVMGSELRLFPEWDKSPINFPIIAYSPTSDRLILWKNHQTDGITWNPTTDMNDALLLMKHIPNYRVELEFMETLTFNCWVFAENGAVLLVAEDYEPARAITIASILSKEE